LRAPGGQQITPQATAIAADRAARRAAPRRAVDQHLQRIYGKLGVDSRFAAAEVAWRAAVDH
jgi:DNA-binding CsgD family transcriptional regulator